MRALRKIASRAKPAGARLYRPFEAETYALLARFTSQPLHTQAIRIDRIIAGLKASGVWSKLDAFYDLAAHDAQAAQRNWKADAYNLTPVDSPTFAAYRGYEGNGSSSYLDMNATLNALTQYQQDSAHLMQWVRTLPTVAGGSEAEIGVFTGSDRTRLRSTNGAGGSGTPAARVNQAFTFNAAGTVTRGTGLIIASRTSSTAITLYRNDDQSDVASVASTAPTSGSLALLRGLSSYSNAQLCFASIGAGLTAADKTSLYAVLSEYLTAVGAA